ncbi:MAG: AraC family transcriptional regulator [Clostridia bacterium]|nr:AraC family transcriptional regulator [Clostridia bacterium]
MAAKQHNNEPPEEPRRDGMFGQSFPYDASLRRFRLLAGGVENWRWHDEIQVCRVKRGRVWCHAGAARVLLEPGQYLFVNSGVLHMFQPEPGCEDAEKETIFFHPSLIADPEGGLYARYVTPLAGCRALSLVSLNGGEPWQAQARGLFDEAYGLSRDAYGWELLCRDLVTRLWLAVAVGNSAAIQKGPLSESAMINEYRAKKMLSFIHERFYEDLTIDAIAASASISRSECFRCFRRSINKKPIEYITEYRIEHAIDLLMHSNLSITDICYQSGFSSTSYFGKVFRNITGMPPRIYRHEMEKLAKASE